MPVGDGHQGSSLVDRGQGVNLSSLATASALGVFRALRVAARPCLLCAGRELLDCGVPDLDESEAVRRRNREVVGASRVVANVDEPTRVEPSQAHRDGRAHERAHHRVAERVGPYGRNEYAVVVPTPLIIVQRTNGRRPFARFAESREVMQTRERRARGAHCLEV